MKFATVKCIVVQRPCFQRFKAQKWIALVYFNNSMYNSHTVAKFYNYEILQLNIYAAIVLKNFAVLKQQNIQLSLVKRFNCINIQTINTIVNTNDPCSLLIDYANQHKTQELYYQFSSGKK